MAAPHAPGRTTEARDHPVDVGFDIDACLAVELLLTVWKTRHGRPGALAEVGGHDLVNVRERDQRRVVRHELELFGTLRAAMRWSGSRRSRPIARFPGPPSARAAK